MYSPKGVKLKNIITKNSSDCNRNIQFVFIFIFLCFPAKKADTKSSCLPSAVCVLHGRRCIEKQHAKITLRPFMGAQKIAGSTAARASRIFAFAIIVCRNARFDRPKILENKKGLLTMEKTIGLIFADSMEDLPFRTLALSCGGTETVRRGNPCCTCRIETDGGAVTLIGVECGIGKVCAAFAAGALIFEEKVDCVFNAGLSGAIHGVRRGDLVLGESFRECDFDLTAIGYAPAQKPDGQPDVLYADKELMAFAQSVQPLHVGALGTGDLFLADKEKGARFYEQFRLTAFDMESAAIAVVCDKCGVPFLCVRQISDDADDLSGADYHEMNDRAPDDLVKLLFAIAKKIGEA